MRVVPPVLKGEKGSFQKFKHEFCLKANMLDLIDQFVGEEKRRVPVGDPLKSRRMLLSDGFTELEINEARKARNFLDEALKSTADREILERCKSPL